MLNHTVGTDISKFFFGGYSLEGNIGKQTRGHNHSSYARLIANDLAINSFEYDLPIVYNEACLVSPEKSTVHCPDVKIVYLQAADKTVFRSFYPENQRYFGKHFRVTWGADLSKSRHYTVCNVMEPRLYNAYVRALEQKEELDMTVFDDSVHDYFIITLKNYKQPSGISSRIFEPHQPHSYQVTGPIGYGMCPS